MQQSRSTTITTLRLILIFAGCFLISGCGAEQQNDRAIATRYQVIDAGDRCVQDVATGLVWEAKKKTPGTHHWNNTYSWFDPDESYKELDYRGEANGGDCEGSACDIDDLVKTVNRDGYCGYNDWRVPSRDELFSISDLARASQPPTIDVDFFPLTHAAEYWTSNDYSFRPDGAWTWHFKYGHDRVDWKKTPKYVRLVRGVATDLAAVKE